jgi:hypothetical protein
MGHVVLNDIPRFAAMFVVALTVRFKALAIFFTPFLSFAIVFLAISIPFFSTRV